MTFHFSSIAQPSYVCVIFELNVEMQLLAEKLILIAFSCLLHAGIISYLKYEYAIKIILGYPKRLGSLDQWTFNVILSLCSIIALHDHFQTSPGVLRCRQVSASVATKCHANTQAFMAHLLDFLMVWTSGISEFQWP